MTALTFSLLFCLAVLLSAVVRLWLASRQIRHVAKHRDQVPALFAERIEPSSHARAADYTIARVRFGLLETAVATLVLVGLTLLGGLQGLHTMLHDLLPQTPWGRTMLLFLGVGLILSVAELPLSLWRQFVLEERFGFNRMSLRLFMADFLRSSLLLLVLAVPLISVILWLTQTLASLWWLAIWGVWVAFNLALLIAYPIWIAPLFNRFEPLGDRELKQRLLSLLERCGLTSQGVFVMDGSRRSAHGNAYFTGLGRSKRIVLFDTLLARLDPAETEAVLAHEIGHAAHRHILQRMLLSFLMSLAALALLGGLAQQPGFHQGLGLTPLPGDLLAGQALLLFVLALPAFTFVLRPFANALSRRQEFQADAFAVAQCGADPLAQALVKLYRDNASTLTPDPLHSAFHDSHPPALHRLNALHRANAMQRDAVHRPNGRGTAEGLHG